MSRNKAYYRFQRKRTIARKIGILRRIGGEEYLKAWSGGTAGRFAKGKIHCSCPLCRMKSYDELTKRDKTALESAKQQLSELKHG